MQIAASKNLINAISYLYCNHVAGLCECFPLRLFDVFVRRRGKLIRHAWVVIYGDEKGFWLGGF